MDACYVAAPSAHKGWAKMNEPDSANPRDDAPCRRLLVDLGSRVAAIAAALPGPNVLTLCRRWRERAAELRGQADALVARRLYDSARVTRSCAIVLELADRDLCRAIEQDAEGCPPTLKSGERPA